MSKKIKRAKKSKLWKKDSRKVKGAGNKRLSAMAME